MRTYIITKHAQEEMAIRGIPESILDVVMQTPGEIVPEKAELVAYQSVISFPEGPMLLRAIVADQDQPIWRGS